MGQHIVIVNYGVGNLNSIKRKLERMKIAVSVSNQPAEILAADKLFLPGVGHFDRAMENIHSSQLFQVLQEAVLVQKKPILGICLGMQIMCQSSEEGNASGLGWLDATIQKFQISDTTNYKVPHIGWNSVTHTRKSELMKDIAENAEFYFLHSYHLALNDASLSINQTEYGYPFVSAVQKENIFGVQYHPEKSHDSGDQLFQNFIRL